MTGRLGNAPTTAANLFHDPLERIVGADLLPVDVRRGRGSGRSGSRPSGYDRLFNGRLDLHRKNAHLEIRIVSLGRKSAFRSGIWRALASRGGS